MNFTNNSEKKYFCSRRGFCLAMILSVVFLLLFGGVGLAVESDSTQYFKMLSTVEYSGDGQFRNQVETVFMVKKQLLGGDKVQYFFSSADFDLAGDGLNLDKSSSGGLSFVVDRKTKRISKSGETLGLLEYVNNECVKYLDRRTSENVGKSWRQSFELPFLGKSFPAKLNFTLKAIQVETNVYGELIAVRALSDPFVIKAAKEGGGSGSVRSRINAVYVFDPEIEDVYLSISVFEATANINSPREKLRHEVATYKTNAAGESVDLSGLGKKFEVFVRELRLAKKNFKIVKESPLPQWAQYEGLNAAQVGNICAAIACEGAPNPVVTVCIPVARTVAMQSLGILSPTGGLAAGGLGVGVPAGTDGLAVSTTTGTTVASSLGVGVPAVGALNIVAAPAFLGVGLGTAGAIAGGTVGGIAAAGGGGGGGGGTVCPD